MDKQTQKLFLLAVFLAFVARASAFVSPTFNVDDLWYWARDFDFVTSTVAFREGRFFGPWLYEFQYALGVNAPRAFAFSAAFLTACLAVTSTMVCRIWKIEGNAMASVLAVAVLTLHPYQTDLYTWKLAMLSGGIPFVMTMWALIIAPRGALQFAGALVLIVLAFGIHQIPLEYAAAALVLAVPIHLARGNFVLREWLRMVAALTVGTILYVIVAKLTIYYTTHFESVGRDSLIVLSDPMLVVDRVEELVGMFLLNDPLTGWLTRVILGVLLLTGCVGVFCAPGTPIGRKFLVLFCLIASLAIAFLCVVALTVVPTAWMPAFRNLMSANLLWAAVIVVAYLLSAVRIRKVVVGLVCLVLFGFMGTNGEILSDQQRANSRDVVLMSRISSDIEKLPDFARIKALAFVGTNTAPLKNPRTGSDFSVGWYNYGTTLSVFSVWWPGYLVALYNEVNGSGMAYVQSEAALTTAYQYCAANKIWPGQGAIKSMGDWVIVCVGPYREPEPGRFEPESESE